MKNDSLKEQYRINERIRVREVRLVGDNIETGVYPIAQASCPSPLSGFRQSPRWMPMVRYFPVFHS